MTEGWCFRGLLSLFCDIEKQTEGVEGGRKEKGEREKKEGKVVSFFLSFSLSFFLPSSFL